MPQFTYNREYDGCSGRDTYHHRIFYFRNLHGTGHFCISRDRGTSKKRGCQTGYAVCMVRWSPGCFYKVLSRATELTTYISPICSITGAMATGIMNTIGCQENSGIWKCAMDPGKANHAACSTPEKSTAPMHIAAMYPAAIPQTIGTSFSMPLPKLRMQMAVMREIKARVQFSFAISTAEGEDKPIRMMIGPITTGGNIRSRNFLPCHLIRMLMRKQTVILRRCRPEFRPSPLFAGLYDRSDESKTASQKYRNFSFCNEVKDESAQTGSE